MTRHVCINDWMCVCTWQTGSFKSQTRASQCGFREISSGCAHCDDKHKCDANMHVGIVHTSNVCCRLWQECLGMYASMTACMYGLCNLLLQIANKVSGRSVVHVPGLKSQGIVRIVTTNSSVMRSCIWELFTQAMCGADSGRND